MSHTCQPPSEWSQYEMSVGIVVTEFSDGCVFGTITMATDLVSSVFEVKYPTNISRPHMAELLSEGFKLWILGVGADAVYQALWGLGPFDEREQLELDTDL